MHILQENQLNKNNIFIVKNTKLIDILLLVFLYTSPVINCVLYILNKEAASGQLALVYIIVALCLIGMIILGFKRNISKKVVALIVFWIVITYFFVFTGQKMQYVNAWYASELKAYLAVSFTIVLFVISISWRKKNSIDNRLVVLLDILITVITFLVVLNSNDVTSGGLMKDSSGFLYQNTSYYAAFGIGMSVYLSCELKLENKFCKWKRISLIFLIVLQMLICFMAGGRGGAVLSMFLLLYGIWRIYGIKGILYSSVPAIVALLFLPSIFNLISINLGVDTKGLERALSIFGDGLKDSNRNVLWVGAIEAFWEKPILGHGIGSIFYLINSYAHNMFIDLLAETGVLGTGIFCVLLVVFVYKITILYKTSSMYRFLTMTFICGFVMNLFSGYIWVNQQVLLPLVLVLTENTKIKSYSLIRRR